MSIWQTDKWGKMLLASNQAEDIFEIPYTNHFLKKEGRKNIFIEKRKIGMGEYALFILGINKNLINKDLIKDLIKLCKKENALFVQIETIDYDNPPQSSFNTKGGSSNLPLVLKEVPERGWIITGYYKKFITPYTAVIEINKTEEEILKRMKPKGRYNIRLAEKKGVEIENADKTKENITKYYNLMLETTSRDNFSGNSLDYYTNFLKKIESSKLLLAYKDNKVIAGGIFLFDKKVSIYYYGASTSEAKYRNLMAPYLLQWKAIQIAKEKGSQIYDFLGVSSPGEKNSSLSGVTSFKKKLTPDIRQVSTSYIWINKKFKYNLIILFRKINKFLT